MPITACCFNSRGNIFAYSSSYDWSKVRFIAVTKKPDSQFGRWLFPRHPSPSRIEIEPWAFASSISNIKIARLFWNTYETRAFPSPLQPLFQGVSTSEVSVRNISFLNDNGGREERPWERGCFHTPYSKMAANKLFFCLHVN